MGEDEQRLHLAAVWREAPCYSARERAALAWCEALTRLPDNDVPSSLFDDGAGERSRWRRRDRGHAAFLRSWASPSRAARSSRSTPSSTPSVSAGSTCPSWTGCRHRFDGAEDTGPRQLAAPPDGNGRHPPYDRVARRHDADLVLAGERNGGAGGCRGTRCQGDDHAGPYRHTERDLVGGRVGGIPSTIRGFHRHHTAGHVSRRVSVSAHLHNPSFQAAGGPGTGLPSPSSSTSRSARLSADLWLRPQPTITERSSRRTLTRNERSTGPSQTSPSPPRLRHGPGPGRLSSLGPLCPQVHRVAWFLPPHPPFPQQLPQLLHNGPLVSHPH
jgi:hypothetical protein